MDLESLELDGWKPTTIERALRVIHLASLLVRGLSTTGQNLLWMTDEEEIVANERRVISFVNLFATVSGHYIPHPMRHVHIGTTICKAFRLITHPALGSMDRDPESALRPLRRFGQPEVVLRFIGLAQTAVQKAKLVMNSGRVR